LKKTGKNWSPGKSTDSMSPIKKKRLQLSMLCDEDGHSVFRARVLFAFNVLKTEELNCATSVY
jgi:hypothetical protein